ncbi:acyl carrier protein [Kitasatospora sp. NBC_00240]|uniref:acyl carrier protein n=1 Tax=Kitasatospora sp. NBC_00240 TaxID=2903567 RepID=UPI00225700A4|nr:acyl carrier protein [Kitasatospora sp. NBC_00240]MCX5214236.1 acyl carrier protein [Kitasatospora sp. NBC_00240]
MSNALTHTELASLIKNRAGITVDPQDMEMRPEATFEEFGIDSLGLLGIVGELENRHATRITAGAEMSRTPAEFIDVVNSSLAAKAGA